MGWASKCVMAGVVAFCAAAPVERCSAQESGVDSVETAFKGKSINFIVALAQAAATNNMRAPWRGIWSAIFPATPMWSCRT